MTKNIVLVTGGTGFIGANLVRRLLVAGFEVYCAVRPGSDLWRLEKIKDQIKFVDFDLIDKQSIHRALQKIQPAYIFHLAAYGSYPFQKEVEKIFETNVIGTINLLEVAEKVGLEKLIVTGTSSEYGKKDQPMKETDLLEPNTAYGVSKASSTLYCQYRAQEAKLPIVIFRPFSVYGPWEEKTRLLPTLIKNCLQGKDLELVSPDIVRDFVYVEDIVEAFLMALDNDKVNGEILNLCSGRQSTIQEVVDIVSKKTQSNSRAIWNQASSGRSFDTKTWVGDPTKSKKLLGWEAKTDLAEGINQTINWFRENNHYYDR